MVAANNLTVGTGGVPRHRPPYSVHEYICRWYGRLDAHRFPILPAESTLTVTMAPFERKMAYASWQRRWKHLGEWRAEEDQTYGKFMDIPFVCSVGKVPYEKRLARLIPKLWADGFTSTVASLELRYGGEDFRKACISLSHEYWAGDIDFKIWLQQRFARKLPLFVG